MPFFDSLQNLRDDTLTDLKQEFDGLSDRFSNLLSEVVTDIRAHVVEEPWFGRAMTERPSFDAMVERVYGSLEHSDARDKQPEISPNI